MDTRFTLLLLCFLLSGFSALLYQTAWMREFAFVFGTSELALAAVLAGYMGGLAAGSAIASRLASRIRRPVLTYGVLELLIALCAVGMPFGLKALTAVYVAAFGGGALAGEPGALAVVFRLTGAFVLLLAPTALMGATLPLLTRHAVRHDEEVGPRVGALYATNTAGAIGGTVVAAFWLLPAVGLRDTVYIGAVVNALVFVAAALLARGNPPATTAETAPARVHAPGTWILPLMTISGAVSFSYEVMWVRLLSQLLGGSVYAFATMLSSFLLGIAVGSAVGGRVASRPERAASAFAWTQLAIAALALGAFAAADLLPQIATWLGAGWKASPGRNAPVAAAALLPAALFIGATFPLAVRVLVRDAADTAAGTARVYAWNTVGAIVGSIGTGFFLLPTLGFTGTALAGAATSVALAAVTGGFATPRRLAPIVASAAAAVALVLLPLENPWRLLRSFPIGGGSFQERVQFFEVGRSATVMVTERPGDFRIFTNGLPESLIDKPEAPPARGLLSRWLGLLPVMLRPQSEDVLVIGLGGGNALEGVPPSVDRLSVVELEPEVVTANRLVGPYRQIDPLANERTRVIVNDARGALVLADTRYDAIVSQPSHPWTAGASHLYTREFFELVRDRLEDDGVFIQWIGLAFVDANLMRSLIATLKAAFPHVQVYMPVPGGVLFAASQVPFDVLGGAAQALRNDPDHLARYSVVVPEDLVARLVLDDAGCEALAEGAVLNTDDHNILSTGSSRVAERGLDPRSFLEMTRPHDPLLRLPGVDPTRMMSSLMRDARYVRAEIFAESLEGADHEIALGLLAAVHGEPEEAMQRFRKVLEQDPTARGAHVGLLLSGLEAVGSEPDDVALVRSARALAQAGDGRALAAREGELASIPRDSLLYNAASRLRSRWRLASGDPERALEAFEILDDLLPSLYTHDIQLSRIEAARLVGRTDTAWIGLDEFTEEIGWQQVSQASLQQALWLARALPQHPLKRPVLGRLNQRLQ